MHLSTSVQQAVSHVPYTCERQVRMHLMCVKRNNSSSGVMKLMLLDGKALPLVKFSIQLPDSFKNGPSAVSLPSIFIRKQLGNVNDVHKKVIHSVNDLTKSLSAFLNCHLIFILWECEMHYYYCIRLLTS